MEKKFSVIKDNIRIAHNAVSYSEAVYNGQMEEIISVLKGKSLTYKEAVKLYESVFSLQLISSSFLRFCIALDSANILRGEKAVAEPLGGNAVYLSNVYSLAAIEKLDKEICKFKWEAETDFTSACEAVYSGRCKYALIPLYNTKDGLIVSLYRLIQKYDLRIVSSVRVVMNDGITETEFFLLTAQDRQIFFGNNHLMLSINHEYDSTLSDILSSMVNCGAVLKYINSLPVEYTDERSESVAVFDITDISLTALKCFLSPLISNYTVVGIYSQVK